MYRWLAIALLIVTAALAFLRAGQSFTQTRDFLAVAEYAEGVVTVSELRGKRRRSYFAAFSFATRDGQTATGDYYAHVAWTRWSVGDRVPVAYDPARLQSARMADWYSLYAATLILALVGIGCIGAAIIVLRWPGRAKKAPGA